LAVARDNDRLTPDFRGDEVAGLGNLAFVRHENPGALENALHFQFKDGRVGVHAGMDAVIAYQMIEIALAPGWRSGYGM